MKIKAIKDFVSGVFAASAGEKLDLPEKKARKLIAMGYAVEIKAKAPAGGESGKEEG